MFWKGLCLRISSFITFLVILLSSNNLIAQTLLKIDGQVLTESKQLITGANVILKSKTGALIVFKSSDRNGNFIFEIKDNAKEFIVETSYLGFQRDSQLVSFNKGDKKINLLIVLKITTTNLREINITHKPNAISIKNDTTTYKVSSFLTGNEEVVEDVLKKLPGVEVSENGKITYKGKSISKVLIEGDDLFSNKYQIGTKNIKSIIVDEVQAIENYEENEKLAGFKKTNETVLNLKIKDDAKNKPNLSMSLAYGYTKNYQADNNLIGVSKSFKYFLFNNVNNVGGNPTPYDYFNFSSTSDESSELSSNQTKIIGIDYSLPILSPKRANVNQNYFSTGNAFIRLNKRLHLTTNYNLYIDKITLIKNGLTEFGKLADGVSYNEYKLITKKPIIGNGSVNLLYDIAKESSIRYISSFNVSKIKNSEELMANYGAFASTLRDKSTSVEQSLEYTNRLSTNSALKIKANYLFISQPQDYLLSPGLNVFDLNLNKQNINLFSNLFNINSEYIFKSKLLVQSFTFKYEKKGEHMMSYLSENKLYTNDLTKNDDNAIIGYTNTLDLNKIQLSTGIFYKIKNSNVSANEISPLKNNINFLSPTLNLRFKLSKYDKFIVANSYDRFLPELINLYPNYILVDNKSLTKGIFQKNVIGRYSFITTYIHSDLFNQFIYFLNFIYIKNTKSYGSSQEINSYYILSNSAIFPGVHNYILTGSVSKYLPIVKSTIKYNSSLSRYQFYNQVNNFAVQSYSAINSIQQFNVKSGFEGWLDFEAGLKYNVTKFNLAKNRNQNAQSYLNLLLKPSEKLFFSISNEFYFNNLATVNYNKYYFLDINAKYVLNKKAIVRLIGKNITDNKVFNTKIIDQLSASTNSYSLLPATLLFEFSYRF